jgi:hypothetical protein
MLALGDVPNGLTLCNWRAARGLQVKELKRIEDSFLPIFGR